MAEGGSYTLPRTYHAFPKVNDRDAPQMCIYDAAYDMPINMERSSNSAIAINASEGVRLCQET